MRAGTPGSCCPTDPGIKIALAEGVSNNDFPRTYMACLVTA